jgi:phage tail tape-measure protein
VCATNCQVASFPEQYVPRTGAEAGGDWKIKETSRWTRTGTSYLENLGKGTSAGEMLSKVNGFAEGAAPALKAVGVVGVVITVGVDIYDVVNAPPGQKLATAVHAAGELAGGIGGAALGAAVAGPVGAIIGGYVGSKVGGAVANWACGLFGC